MFLQTPVNRPGRRPRHLTGQGFGSRLQGSQVTGAGSGNSLTTSGLLA